MRQNQQFATDSPQRPVLRNNFQARSQPVGDWLLRSGGPPFGGSRHLHRSAMRISERPSIDSGSGFGKSDRSPEETDRRLQEAAPAKVRCRAGIIHLTSRRQRETVSGCTMIRLSRHRGQHRENRTQNSRSQRRKHGRRVRPRSSRRFDGGARSIPTAARYGFAVLRFGLPGMTRLSTFTCAARYRQAVETANEFARLKF